MLAGLLAAVTSMATAAPALAATTTSGSASPTSVAIGTPTTVSLTVHGTNNVTSTPTDVIFVLDESGSIAAADFAKEKSFTNQVIQGLSSQGLFAHGGQVGIVQFDHTARLSLALNPIVASVGNAVSGLYQRGGSTCISCGLAAATAEFGAHSAAGHRRLMIFVTDGYGNVNTATEPAAIANAGANGIMRFAIGVGSDVDPGELQRIASQVAGTTTVFQQPDWNSLSGITQGLVASVTSPAATNVQVTATVADGFTPSNPIAPTVPSGVRGTAIVSGQTVTWTLPSLGDETATLSYTVTPKPGAACGSVPVNFRVAYTDAQGGAATFAPVKVDVTGCASGLSFTDIAGTHSYGDAPFTVQAVAGPGGTPAAITAAGACTVTTSVNGSATTGTVTVTGAGTCTLTATQRGANGYADGAITRTFTAGKAIPIVTWTASTGITYGTPLGDAQLNATATVPGLAGALAGTWTYTVADGTDARGRVLNAGQGQALAARFHPADSANVTDATAAASINVAPAQQRVSFAAIRGHKYGDAPFTVTATGGRSNSPITFTAGTGDTCTLSPATAGTDADGNQTGSVQVTLTGAGGCTLTATQNASTDGNYLAGTANTSVSVERATPDLAWNPPAHVTYGTKLDATQLNAAATFAGQPVKGTYAYTTGSGNATGTTPNAGQPAVTVTFTPDNTRDFTAATGSRTITVDKANQTITFPALADHTYGQDPFAAPVTGGASTSPVTLSTPPGAACSVSQTTNGWVIGIVHAGDCQVTAAQGGDGNYNPAASVIQTLHIAQATSTLTWPTPAHITYGTKLGGTQLGGTKLGGAQLTAAANVPGTTVYTLDEATTDATGATPTVGTHTLHAVFTPTDTVNYTAARASMDLTVERATLALTLPDQEPAGDGPLTSAQGTTFSPTSRITTLTGTGFATNTPVTIGIYPNPRVLTNTVTDSTGAFSTEVAIPAGYTGTHTLVAMGLGSDQATLRTLTLHITIAAAATSSTSSKGGLAVTGPALTTTIGLGLALLAIGAAAVITVRRRRPRLTADAATGIDLD